MDELRFKVLIDRRSEQAFRHTMIAGQDWLFQKNYLFNQDVFIHLEEEDDGEYTTLGKAFIKLEDSPNGNYEMTFDKEGAHYEVYYSLSGSPTKKKEKKKIEVKRVEVKPKKGKAVIPTPKVVNDRSTEPVPTNVVNDDNARLYRGFKPSVHGFEFPNIFKLKLDVPIMFLPKFSTVFGLCGGMSLTAADFYTHQSSLTRVGKVPANGSTLFNHLFSQQLRSFGESFIYVGKFFTWWMLQSTLQVQQTSLQEWSKLKKLLDQGKPTTLGLVYVDSGTGKLWDNHQILAYDYEQASPTELYINIYDPNYPKRDDVFIKATLNTVSTSTRKVNRLVCEQHVPDSRVKTIRGFFVIDVNNEKPAPEIARMV